MEAALGQLLFAFSVNLYKQLLNEDSKANGNNLLCSPLTIAATLGMTLAGARNDTAKQIRDLFVTGESSGSLPSARFGTPDGDHAIHDAFASLIRSLSHVFDNDGTEGPAEMSLRFANRLYAGLDVRLSPEFVALVNSSYRASVANVDFVADPEAARHAINEWVFRETASKIVELLPPGSVDSATCVALVNAVYFRGSWAELFDPELTALEPFYETPTRSRKVKMMYRTGRFAVGRHEGLGISLITIPYRNQNVSMVVLLPDKIDGLDDLERRITPSELAAMIASVSGSTKVRLKLPRFKLSTTSDLRRALSALGVTDLFSSRADLSGVAVTGGGSSQATRGNPGCGGSASSLAGGVSVALHRAALEVTEEGTEAAAGSASVVTRRDLRAVEFTADHPFMFLVRTHGPGAAVLFVGNVRRVQDVDA
ncbi:ipis-1-like [Dermacentor albipictus]|uniref:ipis-1-like n=1 Tax=Dermacentor albipictus TaxID=60249 RepID=UPI0031FCA294